MPNKHGVWIYNPETRQEKTRFYPKRCTRPKITQYTPRSESPPPSQRTFTALDEATASKLTELIQEWTQEADRKEADMAKETLEETLARLMFKMDVPLKIREQEKMWDPSGDGSITKGEFRIHIRGIGLTEHPVEEIDDLFRKWDSDNSESIDMDELDAALKDMRREFVRKHGPQGWKFSVEEQIANLKMRADAGRAALAVQESTDKREAEFKNFAASVEASIEVQLGDLLTKRRINVGEVVGTWTRSRGNNAKRELSKVEFKDAIERLGLQVQGRAVSRAELGALFDSVDDDRSGWLNLDEAKAALKKWQGEAASKHAERSAKEKKIAKLKALAAKKLQAAMRPPDSPGSTLTSNISPSPRVDEQKSQRDTSPLRSPGSPGRPRAALSPFAGTPSPSVSPAGIHVESAAEGEALW